MLSGPGESLSLSPTSVFLTLSLAREREREVREREREHRKARIKIRHLLRAEKIPCPVNKVTPRQKMFREAKTIRDEFLLKTV